MTMEQNQRIHLMFVDLPEKQVVPSWWEKLRPDRHDRRKARKKSFKERQMETNVCRTWENKGNLKENL